MARDNREIGQIEIELGEDDLNLVDRLMREGFYGSHSEAVSTALHHQQTGEIDPLVRQRIGELAEICRTAESSAAAHFFADTTELMHIYGRVMKGEEVVEDMNSIYQVLQDRVLDSSNREAEYVESFVEGVFEYAEELQRSLDEDTAEAAVVDNHLDKYDPELVNTIL